MRPSQSTHLRPLVGFVALALLALPALACSGGKPIQLAFVGPLSGPSAEDGQSAVRAIELVLEEANAAGAVKGRRVELSVHDDANDPERAREIARTLASDPRIIAVIGHNTSSCSIAAGAVYAEVGLPAVSSAATSNSVTASNPWYFRVVYNDRDQGRSIVAYLHAVFGAQRFAIVHETDTYGSYLSQVMQEAAGELNVAVDQVWGVGAQDAGSAQRLDAITTSLVEPGDPPVLVLALQPELGVELVRRLRDARYTGRIIVTDALASNAFADGFQGLPRERARPGVYTQGIFASTPFLFDTGGRSAGRFLQDYSRLHDRPPDWYAAFAADAATTLIEALRRGEISPTSEDIATARKQLRGQLAAIGPYSPVNGITGATWFDAVGDAEKPVPIGRFVNGEIASAFVQLGPLPQGLDAFGESSLDPKRIVKLGDERRYRQDVARVGFLSRRFSSLAFSEGTFEMEFDVWFRHEGDRSVEDIVFTNAVQPVVLGDPVDEWVENGLQYRRYRSAGTFRADILQPAYGGHVLGVSVRHRTRSREDLILAIDELGMNLGRSSSHSDRGAAARRLLGESSPWTVADAIFFEDELREPGLGHPAYMSGSHATRPVSELTAALYLKRSGLSLRRALPASWQASVFAASLLASLALLALGRGGNSRLRFALQVVFALAALASLEPLLARALTGPPASVRAGQIERAFDVLWWIVPALLVNSAITRFVWQPAEARSGNPIPTLLRWCVSSVILLIAIFGMIAFVYDYRLTGLLATSGVVAMIIGLAVQLNITNIFAGVALNLERPFLIGDWVMIHGRTPDPNSSVIGQVIDINWRTTRLRTAADTEIVIPNGVISEKTITNFMHPSELSRFELDFTVDQTAPPERVIGLIRDAISSVLGADNNGPVADPPPSVRIKETNERGIVYQVRYRLIPREVSPAKARDTINRAVLRALYDAGIELGYPRRHVYEHRVADDEKS